MMIIFTSGGNAGIMRTNKAGLIYINLYTMRELSRRAIRAGRQVDRDLADDIIIMGLEVYDRLVSDQLAAQMAERLPEEELCCREKGADHQHPAR